MGEIEKRRDFLRRILRFLMYFPPFLIHDFFQNRCTSWSNSSLNYKRLSHIKALWIVVVRLQQLVNHCGGAILGRRVGSNNKIKVAPFGSPSTPRFCIFYMATREKNQLLNLVRTNSSQGLRPVLPRLRMIPPVRLGRRHILRSQIIPERPVLSARGVRARGTYC